jgi:hypothetical protein
LAAIAVTGVLLNFWFDASREASRRGGTPSIGDVLTASKVAPLSLPASVTGAQDSVFYVQGTTGNATAFLVDAENLIFATNAHVPRRIMQARQGQPAQLVLRQANNLKFECKIEPQDVREHPGHELLTKLVDQYSPVIARPVTVPIKGAERLKIKPLRLTTLSAMLGFDAAVLKARKENCNLDAAKPPAALKLANQQELTELGSGSLIARVSFPGGPGNVNSDLQDRNTIPRIDIGYVRAVDGYIPQPSQPTSAASIKHLVAHTLPSTGGTSGGPFLNAQGHVVAINQGGIEFSGNVPVRCFPVSPLNIPSILEGSAPCKTANDGEGRLLGRLDSAVLTQAVARENFAHRADAIHDLTGGKSDADLKAHYTAEIGKALAASLPMVDVLERLNLQQIEGLALPRSAAFDPDKVTTQKLTLTFDEAYDRDVCGETPNPNSCSVRYTKRIKLAPSRNVIVQAADVSIGNLCEMDMELQQVGTNVRFVASGQKPVLAVGGPLPSAEFDLVLTRKPGCSNAPEYLEKLTWNANAVISQFDLVPGSAPAAEGNRLISIVESIGQNARQAVGLVVAPPSELDNPPRDGRQ